MPGGSAAGRKRQPTAQHQTGKQGAGAATACATHGRAGAKTPWQRATSGRCPYGCPTRAGRGPPS
eukprot:11656942-Alexandrium_andersonii.AAC.1